MNELYEPNENGTSGSALRLYSVWVSTLCPTIFVSIWGCANCINSKPQLSIQRGLAQPNEPIFRLLLKIAVRYPHSQLSQLLEHFGVPFSNETLLKHMEHTQKYVGLV